MYIYTYIIYILYIERLLLLMTRKNEASLKQHCHPYQKI